MSKSCSAKRGLEADHTTIWCWVQRYGPELEERLRRHLKPTHKHWRVDETHVRVKGRWCYLYRALDSTGATIDFVLSGLRDAAASSRSRSNPAQYFGDLLVVRCQDLDLLLQILGQTYKALTG